MSDDERRVPVQADGRRDGKPRGTVAWWEHVKAWEDYSRRYGNRQSAERIAERGGFSHWELTDHLGHEPITWRAEVQ